MGTIFSSLRDKKEYYKNEADKLNRRAEEVAEKTENYPEAKRLRDLASKSENAAYSIDKQLRNMGGEK